MWSLSAGGLYIQVVFIYRWSLDQVQLYPEYELFEARLSCPTFMLDRVSLTHTGTDRPVKVSNRETVLVFKMKPIIHVEIVCHKIST